MHRLSSLLSLFVLFHVAIASFERSSFHNRSADIVIVPENIQDDSFLLLLDSTNTEKTVSNSPIDETQIANLISSLVGGPIVNTDAALDEQVVSGHSLFNKAKANLVIFIDGVGADDVKGDLKIKEKAQEIKINRVAYPQDSVATLTTIATGHSPSIHGIVSESWRNTNQDEFSAYENAGPNIFNLDDQFTQTFEALPLIISASSKFQMASATGVNSNNAFGNNYNVYWDNERSSFVDTKSVDTHGLNLTRADILNGTPASSDAEFFFLAELKFLENLFNQLGNDAFAPLVKDNVPDLFSFTFASLKAFKNQDLTSRIQIVDSAIYNAIQKFTNIYSGKVNVQIVFLGTSAVQRVATDIELKNKVFKTISQYVDSAFYTSFPLIYLTERENQQALCAQLRKEISNEVFCPTMFINPTHNYDYVFESNTTVVVDTFENATIFQTVLWMSIIMLIFVIFAVYSVTTISMEVATDPWLQVREETKEHLL